MTTDDYQITREDLTRRLRAKAEELQERIDGFEARLREATEEIGTCFRPVGDRLRSTWQTLRSRLQQLEDTTGEAWEVLVRDLEGGLAQLESEATVAKADLEAELAETRESYREAVRNQLDAWRAGVERLRLQVTLGEMEARDELNDLLERVDDAYRVARQQLGKVEDDTAETLDVLRAGARRVLDDLAAAVDAAWKRFTTHRTG
jgi:DNA repair exonuclease SbcCD ATPase subunit